MRSHDCSVASERFSTTFVFGKQTPEDICLLSKENVMCFPHVGHGYGPETLRMLCRVFEESRIALGDGAALRADASEDRGLLSELGRAILEIYTDGQKEPEMLKQVALLRVGHKSRLDPAF